VVVVLSYKGTGRSAGLSAIMFSLAMAEEDILRGVLLLGLQHRSLRHGELLMVAATA
jgi:hypothetical protein